MKKYYLIIPIIGILYLAGHLISKPAKKWARAHVNYITEVDDHPLNCLNCHLYEKEEGPIYKILNRQYISPLNLTLSKEGNKMYVVGQEGNVLLEVDVTSGKVIHKIKVGEHPHSVVLNSNNTLAYVSNQWSDYISVIDLGTSKEIDSLKTGNGPAGLAISNDNNYLYVVNSFSSDISVLDLNLKKEKKRLAAGNNPTCAKISPDGNNVFVTSRRTLPMPYNTPPMTELTVLNTNSQYVTDRIIFEKAYVMENVAFTPSGDLAIATLIRPKNLIPSIQVEKGWMMNHGIGIIERKEGGRIFQFLLDEPNAYYSDPFDIAITPDGKKAFISNAGVNVISVIDIDSLRDFIANTSEDSLKMYANHLGISSKYVITRIATGANPKGLSLSPDGKLLYVAERLEDRIAIINTDNLEVSGHIDLKGPSKITMSRRGRRLFNNAGRTFENQYSCYTCHPDAHEDGLVYNMAAIGRNITNVQTLRDIGDTPPFKWNGKNQSIHKQDGMRFSKYLTRTESFNYDDLDALVCYIRTGIKDIPNLMYNPDENLTPAQQRGKAIFYRTHDNFGNEIPASNRCYTCHPPPYFTNLQMADVGTLAATDDSMLFDTPQLNNIFASSPYLHDGSAPTLEEIWTKFNPEDKHGVANDMLKDQLNDLVEYLKSIREADYYVENPETASDSLLSYH
ncbi:MAG: beta-propeller fold lactonase family protein [Bacteroidales bacterium]|nr:beta-propeller fold lactonase family protein [Bacteroidales bacterium]